MRPTRAGKPSSNLDNGAKKTSNQTSTSGTSNDHVHCANEEDQVPLDADNSAQASSNSDTLQELGTSATQLIRSVLRLLLKVVEEGENLEKICKITSAELAIVKGENSDLKTYMASLEQRRSRLQEQVKKKPRHYRPGTPVSCTITRDVRRK
ncbi:hypothetical protein BDY21DRAFT_352765 [Lineolata rhizophorae]|uniref:Uncharacterized protein n=1 Tax=Lineolata rhizophorae TaxID=578093 RepID=A0A6A6NRQ6_9PEZI|nr:hypothetical protein BDY21DRAFT_352765 [Lineolata rhizophorae]